MTKKLKKSKNNMITDKHAKSVVDVYRNMNEMKNVPVNSIIIEEMAKAIIRVADLDEDILTMTQIYKKFGLLEREFFRLRNKYPQLEEAYEFAMERIADKRELKAAKNEWNWGVINSTQAHYSRIAKEQAEWRSSLRTKEENKAQNITVYLDPIPNSDLVPVKKDK